MTRSLEQWLHWHQWLESALDLPCPAYIISSEPKIFVLVHQLYDPREVDPMPAGLICDVRQENRPMLVPLAEMEFDAQATAGAILSAYRDWVTAAT